MSSKDWKLNLEAQRNYHAPCELRGILHGILGGISMAFSRARSSPNVTGNENIFEKSQPTFCRLLVMGTLLVEGAFTKSALLQATVGIRHTLQDLEEQSYDSSKVAKSSPWIRFCGPLLCKTKLLFFNHMPSSKWRGAMKLNEQK